MSEGPMTDEEKRLREEARAAVDDVNRRLKPIEDAFMAYVSAYKVIGYGRMMQLIQDRWSDELAQRRSAHFSESGGKGYVKDVP